MRNYGFWKQKRFLLHVIGQTTRQYVHDRRLIESDFSDLI